MRLYWLIILVFIIVLAQEISPKDGVKIPLVRAFYSHQDGKSVGKTMSTSHWKPTATVYAEKSGKSGTKTKLVCKELTKNALGSSPSKK